MFHHMQKCKLLRSGLNNRPFHGFWSRVHSVGIFGVVWVVNFSLSPILSISNTLSWPITGILYDLVWYGLLTSPYPPSYPIFEYFIMTNNRYRIWSVWVQCFPVNIIRAWILASNSQILLSRDTSPRAKVLKYINNSWIPKWKLFTGMFKCNKPI